LRREEVVGIFFVQREDGIRVVLVTGVQRCALPISVDYRAVFIDRLNDRLANYSECGFDEDGPAYDFLRYLAHNVSDIMSVSDDKCVFEQVMVIEAPELVGCIRP